MGKETTKRFPYMARIPPPVNSKGNLELEHNDDEEQITVKLIVTNSTLRGSK